MAAKLLVKRFGIKDVCYRIMMLNVFFCYSN